VSRVESSVKILGVKVSSLSMAETVEAVLSLIEKRRGQVVTANAEILYTAHREPSFKKVLLGAELVTADGMGVVLASKILGSPVPERVSGYDLLHAIAKRAAELGLRIYLLGGKAGVAERAAEKLRMLYPGLIVAGTGHGYFADGESQAVIKAINAQKTDFLFVALGLRGDYWLAAHKQQVECASMQVGGSFDVLAGLAVRAPLVFQKTGLEWAYRLYKEPWRYKRMLSLPKFVLAVLAECFRGERKVKP